MRFRRNRLPPRLFALRWILLGVTVLIVAALAVGATF
ncbi:hypothetical protein MicloDRAFT_00010360 [Microvirga lotononidis]|uniref:Uncharacterized protein n=1 Tax=Microvirga lotononidis TaxID=864069 RepID=I4Z1Y9_9HYPH|nr:hypothetical protein MicloDRAFT_00010360 [Microvirga lotononidis]